VGTAVRNHNLPPLSLATWPTFIVPNGVDITAFSPIGRLKEPDRALRIGTVARLRPEKGHPELLRAVAKLAGEGRRVDLELAGEGSALCSYRKLARDLSIADAVHFHGVVTDIPSFLRRLDIFVLPSFSEGLPITILEAMATGLPVIATMVGAIPEVLFNGRNALLVEPGDIDALASAIRQLHDDVHLRETLGSAAREAVRKRHSHDVFANQVMHIYKTILC
jgi:glycosyltransferase involved in cell wall biosynthesis